MSRDATIATVCLPINEKLLGSKQTLTDIAFEAIERAGGENPDIVCLPELWDALAQGGTMGPGAQPPGFEPASGYRGERVPGGPLTTRIQEKARQLNCYIVHTTLETDADRTFITAAVVGRDGSIIGKYRKTHLTPDDMVYATPGSDLPVFDCDFGCVAVMLGSEIYHPEVARTYALKGADIIFWPTMLPDYPPHIFPHMLAVRALENQVFCVCGSYMCDSYYSKPAGEARIVDPFGSILANTGKLPGVAVASVDLDQADEVYDPACPPLRQLYLERRRPELYDI